MTQAVPDADPLGKEGEGDAATPRFGLPPVVDGDTWITVGDPETEEERTVTVVFRRDPLDEAADPLVERETGEFLLRPLVPRFPAAR